MMVCNWITHLHIVPSKALRKQIEGDLPPWILDILPVCVKIKSWEVNLMFPIPALGIDKVGSCVAQCTVRVVKQPFPVVFLC